MNLRALKILVAAMGAMLVIGFAVLLVTIAWRLSHRPAAPPSAFTAPPVTLPHGSVIERMSTAADRIILQVDLADGNVELVVIDLSTGRQLGIVPLREAP